MLTGMPVVLLVRHGRTDANGSGVLAGRTPGVGLDDAGRAQIEALRGRIARVPLSGVVSSPLDRCRQTADILVGDDVELRVDDALTECDYGSWTGRRLVDLRREKAWRVVQDHPSGAVFPGGESLAHVQARAVAAIRDHDRRVAAAAGPQAVWMAVSHGDVIKAIVADALGMHLDLFQRIVVDPGSVTAVSYTEVRPFVLRLNDTGGDLTAFRPPRRRRSRARSSDAAVGGGGGPSPR
jgi:probable phosphomutase (TIGR03848 family)